jgi:hypothetical protein
MKTRFTSNNTSLHKKTQLTVVRHENTVLLSCSLNGSHVMVKHGGPSVRAFWGIGLGCLDTSIMGSNPAKGINVLPRLSVLWCPVEVEALRRANPPTSESYEMSNSFIISEVILNWNRYRGLTVKLLLLMMIVMMTSVWKRQGACLGTPNVLSPVRELQNIEIPSAIHSGTKVRRRWSFLKGGHIEYLQ